MKDDTILLICQRRDTQFNDIGTQAVEKTKPTFLYCFSFCVLLDLLETLLDVGQFVD